MQFQPHFEDSLLFVLDVDLASLSPRERVLLVLVLGMDAALVGWDLLVMLLLLLLLLLVAHWWWRLDGRLLLLLELVWVVELDVPA